MCGANLLPILNNGQDAGNPAGRPFTVLSLQSFAADVLGVRGKALCRGHDPVEVRWKAFGARCTGVAPGQRFSWWHFGRPVFIAVGAGSHLGRPPSVIWLHGPRRYGDPGGDLRFVFIGVWRSSVYVAVYLYGWLVEGSSWSRMGPS